MIISIILLYIYIYIGHITITIIITNSMRISSTNDDTNSCYYDYYSSQRLGRRRSIIYKLDLQYVTHQL